MSSTVSITFLGGLGAIGRNCLVVTSGGRSILIDCGIMFPDPDMLGVDLVLPDFTWLRQIADQIDGCVITHGHEDHHGALSYLLRDCAFPIYGSRLSLELARNRIEEAGLLGRTELIAVGDYERRNIGEFDCEFLPVTHSVPSALAVALHTSQGVVLHTGDFKIDRTPIDGRLTAMERIAELARSPGIRLLLSDSTNAEMPGRCPSEASVRPGLEEAFDRAEDRRVVASCTSSQLHRVQQILEVSQANNRKVATVGLSIRRNVRIGRDLGIFSVADADLIDIEAASRLAPSDLCVIATGAQGEPMSTLARAATEGTKFLEFTDRDLVLLSSRAIPGNEGAVNRMINNLVSRGVEVVHSGVSHVHASGHANRDELLEMLTTAQPECFLPVHGEPRHLVAHARLARLAGIPDDSILMCDNGDRVVLSDDGWEIERGAVPAQHIFVDGLLPDVSDGLLRDRRILGTEGILAVVVAVDFGTRTLLTTPRVVSQGWIEVESVPHVIEGAQDIAERAMLKALDDRNVGLDELRRILRRSVGEYVSNTTRRRPVVAPVVLEL